ncbi:MAG: hypothetical protein HZR80_11170 [Candidatus Heimdallarchaeota archaeon]
MNLEKRSILAAILFFILVSVPTIMKNNEQMKFSDSINIINLGTSSPQKSILDATPPGDNITELSVLDDIYGMYPRDVCINGSYAYIATDEGGLVVVNISDPINPVAIDCFWDEYQADEVYVEDEYVYLGHSYLGLQIFNASDPSSITKIGQYDSTNCVDFQIVGDTAYIADQWTDIVIVDITDRTNPTKLGDYDNATTLSNGIYVQGSYAYVTHGLNGIHVVDISNPSTPIEVSYFNYAGSYWDIVVDGPYGYATGNSRTGLQTINFTDINNPEYLNLYAIGNGFDIEKQGNLVCVNDYHVEARFYDVSDVENIQFINTYNTANYGLGNSISCDIVAITDYCEGLYLVNISEMFSTAVPTLLGNCFLGGAVHNTFVYDDLLFVAKGYGGLDIYNVSNPVLPELKSNLDISASHEMFSVYVYNDIAYVGVTGYGLAFIDFSIPANPIVLNTVLINHEFRDIHVDGNYTFVAANYFGLEIYNNTSISTAYHLSAYDDGGSANVFM